jgi:tetratricopeptide (TPR) repeat protein
VVEYGKHKISRYDVTERLFRIWRQTATISGKKKFQIFIRFLKLYFTPEELKSDFQHSMKQIESAFKQNRNEIVNEKIHYLSYLQQAAEGGLKYEIFDKRTDLLFKVGDFFKAEEEIIEYKKEVELEKKDYDLKSICKKLMNAHLQQEKYPEVCKDIAQIIQFPISDDKDELLGILDKILEKSPDDDKAWFLKGAILLLTGNHEEALVLLDRAIEFNPNESFYYHIKALILRFFNRNKEALPIIEKGIKLDEKVADYWQCKGGILLDLEKYEESLLSFEKASELEPEKAEFYSSRSYVLYKLNRFEESLLLIEKAIEIDEKNSEYRAAKGFILSLSKKYGNALHNFQRAIELKPGEAEYYLLQANALRNLNRFEEALGVIEKAIELERENLSYWREKASILAKAGKYEEGIKCFRESIELNPEDLDHKLEFLGFLIYSIQDMEEAEQYLNEIENTVFEQIQDNLIYLRLKSKYLMLTCRFEEAVPWTEKRKKKEPDDWDAKISYLINKACLGDFGDNMEGLAGKISKENLGEFQVKEVTNFVFRIIERCLLTGDTQRAEGLYVTLLKLNEWHTITQVQESIALVLRKLVDVGDRDLFVNAVNFSDEYISEKDLLELIKAFVYAGRYLQEGNKVIFEEVFPEIREIIFDIIKKFEGEEVNSV